MWKDLSHQVKKSQRIAELLVGLIAYLLSVTLMSFSN